MESYVLITGASRGIGKNIAYMLASRNYNLILICKNNFGLLRDLANTLSCQYKVKVICKICDISDPTQVESLFADIPAPDIIINNAGISYVGLLQDMSVKDWNTVIATNLSAAFYISKYALKHMISKQSGRILNISSVWGNTGASMEVAYSASKGGLNAFTKSLAKEVAPSGIAVNALACGFVDTEMNSHLCDEEKEFLFDQIPAGRAVSTQEVALTAIQILEMPIYLTGQIITLDGGWT